MKTIVISAITLRKGGTLKVLKECLEYLSILGSTKEYRIIALVYKRELVDLPNIEYIEFKSSIKSWFHRLWYEFIGMYAISKTLAPVDLWVSLHDVSPRVKANRRAVYCQTSFPFLKIKFQDIRFDYKIVLFNKLGEIIYRINLKKNINIIVQSEWLRNEFSTRWGVEKQKFIVFPPVWSENKHLIRHKHIKSNYYTFIYPATPDCHKNFELICRASAKLENLIGKEKFKVFLTINGHENKYSSWIYKNWGNINSIEFIGYQTTSNLNSYYDKSDCLIFPSRVETWGLPISEFSAFGKPMLLADLPYSHEASAGSLKTCFFNPEDSNDLMNKMQGLIGDNQYQLKYVEKKEITPPKVQSWDELFNYLLR